MKFLLFIPLIIAGIWAFHKMLIALDFVSDAEKERYYDE